MGHYLTSMTWWSTIWQIKVLGPGLGPTRLPHRVAGYCRTHPAYMTFWSAARSAAWGGVQQYLTTRGGSRVGPSPGTGPLIFCYSGHGMKLDWCKNQPVVPLIFLSGHGKNAVSLTFLGQIGYRLEGLLGLCGARYDQKISSLSWLQIALGGFEKKSGFRLSPFIYLLDPILHN